MFIDSLLIMPINHGNILLITHPIYYVTYYECTKYCSVLMLCHVNVFASCSYEQLPQVNVYVLCNTVQSQRSIHAYLLRITDFLLNLNTYPMICPQNVLVFSLYMSISNVYEVFIYSIRHCYQMSLFVYMYLDIIFFQNDTL